eukprot:5159851-Pleurochrysis_carterae.AAC.2
MRLLIAILSRDRLPAGCRKGRVFQQAWPAQRLYSSCISQVMRASTRRNRVVLALATVDAVLRVDALLLAQVHNTNPL